VRETVLLQYVRDALIRNGLAPGTPVVAGVSGGIDSLVLLHTLVTLAARGHGPRVTVVHVDHGLRPESAEEGRRVMAYARTLGVESRSVAVDVGIWDRSLNAGVEAAARAARYAALGEAARRIGSDWVLVGHNRDDQAETVLLHLARGAGLDGLAGMRELSRRALRLSPDGADTASLTILRPLLGIPRRDLDDYARTHDLQPLEDPSNFSPVHRRNAIRHRVLPPLEEALPGAASAVARAASLLRDDLDLLDASAAVAAQDVVLESDGLTLVVRGALRRLHPALQRRVLRLALSLAGMERVPDLERLEALRNAVLSGTVSTRLELGGGVAARVAYEDVAIGPDARLDGALRRASAFPLLEPGTTIAIDEARDLELGNGWYITCRPVAVGSTSWVLRTRRPGDRVAAPGARVVRLQNWMVNRKVPSYLRDWLPLIERDGVVRWVGGVCPPACLVDDALQVHLERGDTGG